MDFTPPTLEVIAYHESGHAIVAAILRFTIDYVSVDPGNLACPNFGITEDSSDNREKIEDRVMVLCAGCVSNHIAGQSDWVGIDEIGWCGLDYDDAMRLSRCLYKDDTEAILFIGRMQWRVHKLLRNPKAWRAVDCLAGRLLNNRRVTGQEVYDAIAPYEDDHGPLDRRTLIHTPADAVRFPAAA